ncbi:MAG: cytochrome C [Acidobacteria bacterium]|nr:MAG: cytochrome C [Acidobacteriota bacterium]REK04584.1 MAG: cytochrome C [Acidobacteriota bacterium]
MAQTFPRSANQISKVSLILALAGAGAAGALLFLVDRSPLHTKQGTFVNQEVPFSHDHHTAGLGIDCRYCHTAVEESSSAGIPPTATCMNCHKIIWANTEMLQPVRDSWATGQPLRWNRVNDLPDYVYFNHSVHVSKGIGCESCHGPVNEMPLVYQAHSLQMRWCLECHRAPEKFVRPREEVFNFDWKPSDVGMSQKELGAQLVEEYEIASLDQCSVCHR